MDRSGRMESRGAETDARGERIRLAPGTRLDLGGIAKGYIVQAAVREIIVDIPTLVLHARAELPVGTAVELLLISPSMFCREQLVAEVIWQTADEVEGGFLTGLQFRSPLTRFALLDFVVQHQGQFDAFAQT